MTTEQRSAIKFCVLNKTSRKDTIQMLERAHGIRAMKKSQVYEWYGRFKNGPESINDEPRSGEPASITSRHVTEIRDLLELTTALRFVKSVTKFIAALALFTAFYTINLI